MGDVKKEPAREQWATQTDEHRTDFAKAEKPIKYQVCAWALWIVCLAVEFIGVLAAAGSLRVPLLTDVPVLSVAIALVAGLALVLTAQRLWKKAGSLARDKHQGVIGVVMACAAYVPMCLFFLTAKNADTKTRVASVVAALVAAALITALCLLLPGDPTAVLEGAAQ